MGIARSTYYYESVDKKLILNEIDLRDLIEFIHIRFPGYGYRRLHYHPPSQEIREKNCPSKRIVNLICACVILSLIFCHAIGSSAGEKTVSHLSSLLNLNQKQLIQKLGKPDTKNVFEMKEASNEFRIELQNTYPLTDKKNLKVQIREWTWNKGNARTTVWLHQIVGTWKVLHVKDWHKDTDF